MCCNNRLPAWSSDFKFFLARELKMTVTELQSRMSEEEQEDWHYYFRRKQQQDDDLAVGILAQAETAHRALDASGRPI